MFDTFKVPKLYLLQIVHLLQKCNSSCMYKRPVSQDCGSGEECVCNGKDKKYCQPDEPEKTTCYTPKKALTDGSFMCDPAYNGCVLDPRLTGVNGLTPQTWIFLCQLST